MTLDISKVKNIMLNKGLSFTDLSNKTNIPRSSLSRMLSVKNNSKVSRIITVNKIALALDVEPISIVKEA